MKKFTVYNSKGQKGNITIGEVVKKGNIAKFKIIELKFNNNTIVENAIGSFVKTTKKEGLFMNFDGGNLLLEIRNQDLIEYAFKLNDKIKSGILYNYTNLYKNNYLD